MSMRICVPFRHKVCNLKYQRIVAKKGRKDAFKRQKKNSKKNINNNETMWPSVKYFFSVFDKKLHSSIYYNKIVINL